MELLNPLQYLAIDVANNADIKGSWKQRLYWFRRNEHRLEKVSGDPLYQAAVHAYRNRNGKYLIGLDAQASGIQMLAILTHDEKAIFHCGLDSQSYKDIYTELFKKMKLSSEITRKDAKKALMTHCFGSELNPQRRLKTDENLLEFYRVLNEEIPKVSDFIKASLTVMWNPKASSYQWTMPDGFNVDLKVMVPINTTIKFKDKDWKVQFEINEPSKQGRELPSAITHSTDALVMREMIRRCNFPTEKKQYIQRLIYKEFNTLDVYPSEDNTEVERLWNLYIDSGFLSVKILNHINGANINLIDRSVILELLNSLPTESFHVSPIHDCFYIHPKYGNDLRKQYNQVLKQLWDSNLLAHILKHIDVSISKDSINKSIGSKILNCNYSLT